MDAKTLTPFHSKLNTFRQSCKKQQRRNTKVPDFKTNFAELKKKMLAAKKSYNCETLPWRYEFPITKASWQRKSMFVYNIHSRGVWIKYGSSVHLR